MSDNIDLNSWFGKPADLNNPTATSKEDEQKVDPNSVSIGSGGTTGVEPKAPLVTAEPNQPAEPLEQIQPTFDDQSAPTDSEPVTTDTDKDSEIDSSDSQEEQSVDFDFGFGKFEVPDERIDPDKLKPATLGSDEDNNVIDNESTNEEVIIPDVSEEELAIQKYNKINDNLFKGNAIITDGYPKMIVDLKDDSLTKRELLSLKHFLVRDKPDKELESLGYVRLQLLLPNNSTSNGIVGFVSPNSIYTIKTILKYHKLFALLNKSTLLEGNKVLALSRTHLAKILTDVI